MDIVGTSLSAAQALLAALQCSELKEILEIIGYQSQLEDLKHTVEAVIAVLRDAETKHELSEHTQFLIGELKDAVFEADDLLDEFVTLAQQKQLLQADGSLSQKVRSFFSRSNPLGVAYRMSRGVKKIKKRLDGIAYNKQFNFEHDPVPLRNRSRETCSYVNEVDIIGRDDDLDYIVATLLDDSSVKSDVSFFSIVGIGGLGKTALAQLVFNDHRVTSAFPLRVWTCVSDQDQKQLDVTQILRVILASVTGRDVDQGSTLEQTQRQLRQELAGKKCLLVLDDVWTENRHEWCGLVQYLIGGERGSWIVVTTRSQETAIVVDGLKYELPGLSEENSWRLFEKTAFASDQLNPPRDLVNIGREIVDGCARVPLAIKVAGSLLFGQDKSKWLLVQKIGIANIRDEKKGIMPILKLSYHHLASPLKSCFSYCALFPKDFLIQKEMLISLWMAQSYIVPLDYGQSIKDAAEEYFSILLRRCFFQDIAKDAFGVIHSCKIHDLMHDIAQSVSRKEIYVLNTINGGTVDDKKVRHLSIAGTRDYGRYPLGKTHIRSHLFVDSKLSCPWFLVEALIANCRSLRVLNLQNLRVKSLPNSIAELLHLRYLDLSGNYDLVVLPKSITKLCNLQTLKLMSCLTLKELPKDMSRLCKLRVLDILGCKRLTYMPRGMGKLTNLERLRGWYVLGGEGNCSSWREWFYGLEDLKTLSNLQTQLEIKIRWPENAENNEINKEDSWSWSWSEGLNLSLRSMEHLNFISFEFENQRSNGTIIIRLMEALHPHSNLKQLDLKGYNAVKFPSCVTATSLPHLVRLILRDCVELEFLPLFPSLEILRLEYVPKLKGVGVGESSRQLQQLLPCLSELHVIDCPELTGILHCPRLEVLWLDMFNIRIRIVGLKLRKLVLEKGSWLYSMPIESFKYVWYLCLGKDNEMEYLPNCVQYCSALEEFKVIDDKYLKAMPTWMPKLTSLKSVTVVNASENLERRCQKDPPGEDWPYIQHVSSINIFPRHKANKQYF